MPRGRAWPVALAVACLAGGSTRSCTQGRHDGRAAPATAPVGRQTPRHGPDVLWSQLAGEPETLDPGRCSESLCGEVVENLFAGLVQVDPNRPGALMGDLAASWRVDDGGRRWTFTLRPSGWSDGAPVTAHDFVYAWRRVLDPATASRSAEMLHVLAGGAAFAAGKVDAAAVGVTALADDVLEVRLHQPVPYFLHLCAHTLLRPVPAHVLRRFGDAGRNVADWSRPENLVGNGAYALTRWRFRRDVALARNPHYWDAAHVRLQRVHLRMVANADTCAQLYFAGEVDLTGPSTPLPTSYAEALRHTPDFRAEPALNTAFYWLNTRRPPLDDVRVRQALSLAIDRELLVARVLRGAQRPSDRLVPPTLLPLASPAAPPAFDPPRARRLLAEAGYGPGGNALRPLRLVYNAAESNRQVAEAIQMMWRRHLGVTTDLDNQEWRIYLGSVAEGDFDVARMGWQGDWPDAENFLANVFGPGNNASGWDDPAFAALLAQAAAHGAVGDGAARERTLQAAESLALAAQPLLPLYHGAHTALVKAYVRGWRPNPLLVHAYKHLWLQPSTPTPQP